MFSFSGSLSSRLAIFHVTYPFVTLDGVIDSGYLIGGEAGGAPVNGFLTAPEGSIRRKIADKLIRPNKHTMLGRDEGMQKVLREKFAMLFTAEEIQYLSEDSCAYMEIPYDIETFKIGFGFPKQSHFINLFSYFIRKNIENGNLDRIRINWSKSGREM